MKNAAVNICVGMVFSSLDYIPRDGIGSDDMSNCLKNHQTTLQSTCTTDVRFKSRSASLQISCSFYMSPRLAI